MLVPGDDGKESEKKSFPACYEPELLAMLLQPRIGPEQTVVYCIHIQSMYMSLFTMGISANAACSSTYRQPNTKDNHNDNNYENEQIDLESPIPQVCKSGKVFEETGSQ